MSKLLDYDGLAYYDAKIKYYIDNKASDGAEWFTGTSITGTGTQTAVITGSNIGDMYLNSNTGYVYKCTSANTWVYQCSIKGTQGNPGINGEDGSMWFIGDVLENQDESVLYSATVTGAKVGDYYINKYTGSIYTCEDVTGTSSYWRYKYSIKGGKWWVGTQVTGTSTTPTRMTTTSAYQYDMYLNSSTLNYYSSDTGTDMWKYEGNLASTAPDTFANTITIENETSSSDPLSTLTGNHVFGGTIEGTSSNVDYVGFQIDYGGGSGDRFQLRSGNNNKDTYRISYRFNDSNDSTSWSNWNHFAFIEDFGSWALQSSKPSYTYSEISNTPTLGTAAAKNVVDTYSSTGTDCISGKGVAAAITGLNVTGSSSISASKTISAWSEANGKVSISTQNISIGTSQVSGLASYIDGRIPSIPSFGYSDETIDIGSLSWTRFSGSSTPGNYAYYNQLSYSYPYNNICAMTITKIDNVQGWTVVLSLYSSSKLQINLYSAGATSAPSISGASIKVRFFGYD